VRRHGTGGGSLETRCLRDPEGIRTRTETKHTTPTNDDKHAIRLLRILDFRKETRSQAERQRYFGRLVEVGLQHVSGQSDRSRAVNFKLRPKERRQNRLVENKEALEDLQFVLVRDAATDFVMEFCIRQRGCVLETLVRQRGADECHASDTTQRP